MKVSRKLRHPPELSPPIHSPEGFIDFVYDHSSIKSISKKPKDIESSSTSNTQIDLNNLFMLTMPGGDAPSASTVIRLTIPKTFGGDTAHLNLGEVGRKVPGKHCGLLFQLGLGVADNCH